MCLRCAYIQIKIQPQLPELDSHIKAVPQKNIMQRIREREKKKEEAGEEKEENGVQILN